jgi:threonine dehydratase
MTDIAMIEAAAARLAGHARVTPLLESDMLNDLAGRRVLVKAECLQRTGSFKFRGAWNALSLLPSGAGVLAYSSGNHAQGVALAARLQGRAAVIVMPADAPGVKISNTRGYGAEVVLYDRRAEDRDAIGARLAAERHLHLVKPFDDATVIAGQGTAGLEIATQAAEAGVTAGPVLTCCGGGGLTAGIAVALATRAPGFRVHPVEPTGFDDAGQSLAAGRIMAHQGQATICDAIMTPAPGQVTFPLLMKHCGPGFSVTDAEVRQAMALAFAHLRIVLEPGGAVGLTAALFRGGDLPGGPVICTASGGNVDPGLFESILRDHAV